MEKDSSNNDKDGAVSRAHFCLRAIAVAGTTKRSKMTKEDIDFAVSELEKHFDWLNAYKEG